MANVVAERISSAKNVLLKNSSPLQGCLAVMPLTVPPLPAIRRLSKPNARSPDWKIAHGGADRVRYEHAGPP
jgi:hypothetical protein